ncbi:hypothetical protein ONZ51_g9391 [Trametes cubensis]|uniref:HNH nuclease domain-containing protein n=1 Tax=Trametes cubensis TaxID=1111947 RepID=A0AAD7TLV0_9APHY|nr:hypothetical protein ONZ51_g9391 [Trametes cubensis]
MSKVQYSKAAIAAEPYILGGPITIQLTRSSRSLYDKERAHIINTGHRVCRLCDAQYLYKSTGHSRSVVVAHIVARTAHEDHQLLELLQAGVVPTGFNKLSASNLFLLCDTHHKLYDDGCIVIMPTLDEIKERTIALRERRPVNHNAFKAGHYLFADVVLSGTVADRGDEFSFGNWTTFYHRLLETEGNTYPQEIVYRLIDDSDTGHPFMNVEFQTRGNFLDIILDWTKLPQIDPSALMRKAYYSLGRLEYPSPKLIYAHPSGTRVYASDLRRYREALREWEQECAAFIESSPKPTIVYVPSAKNTAKDDAGQDGGEGDEDAGKDAKDTGKEDRGTGEQGIEGEEVKDERASMDQDASEIGEASNEEAGTQTQRGKGRKERERASVEPVQRSVRVAEIKTKGGDSSALQGSGAGPQRRQ